MRILIATPIYPPEIGGPATYTVELQKRLTPAHEVTVIVYTNTPRNQTTDTLIEIKKGSWLPIRLGAYFWALFKASKNADIIYVQNAVASGLPAMLVGKLQKKPVILKFVGDEAWERATQNRKTSKSLEEFLDTPEGGVRAVLMMWLQGIVLRNVSLVTTPSQYLGDAIQNTYRIKKDQIQTNYNASDTQEAMVKKMNPYQICSTSRLTSWKHIDQIIEAVDTLKKNFPQIHLSIAGDGPERESLELLVAKKSLEKHVTFLGNIAKEDIRKLLSASSLFILNSTYEGLPHGVLEAFGARVPVIATDIPGTDEVVFHEKTGLLVPPSDTEKLTATIQRLFENNSLREKLASEGYALLQSRFSWKNHIDTLETFFQKITRGG